MQQYTYLLHGTEGPVFPWGMIGNYIDKLHPRTGHEGLEGEQMFGSTLSLTSALGGVGG